jgi:ABC-type nitrate/sulfonate/bicarbonate transport system permease component
VTAWLVARRILLRLLVVLGLPVVLVATWWFTSDGSQSFYFPPLRETMSVFRETWFDGGTDSRLVAEVLPSLARLAVGYAVAAVLGIALGLVIGQSRVIRAVVEPTLEVFRAIPPPVVIPVLAVLAGIENTMKVLVIVFGCIWPILLNAVEGVRAVDQVSIDTCRSYGVRGLARIRFLVLPSAAPQIVTGLRQALSIGLILMVISEMFAASDGVGFTIVQFQRGFALPQMWTGIIVLGVLGVALSLAFRFAEQRVLRWYHGLRATHLRSH